ncbi:hypothetical protein DPMN_078528 [Dreissena polymorpha]|uniref:Methyltransferase FkbM domain-containing protein n=1 Tax=Dreissena polymorpha TaxID=45954 RepID=A0A9D3YNZ9_DREPO|nr:hypothetical protein DPMN_078528 [Dreissena polymorpha]
MTSGLPEGSSAYRFWHRILLLDILNVIGTRKVDYFALDVDGAELYILESIDWNQIDIDVFTIETDQNRDKIIIVDCLIVELPKRLSACSGLDKLFGFMTEFESLTLGDLRECATHLVKSSPDDIEASYVDEFVHSKPS